MFQGKEAYQLESSAKAEGFYQACIATKTFEMFGFLGEAKNVIPLHRGSYMSAYVLLNLLNELGKRDKMRGLPSVLSLFRNEFNKFNNTRARMLDSIIV